MTPLDKKFVRDKIHDKFYKDLYKHVTAHASKEAYLKIRNLYESVFFNVRLRVSRIVHNEIQNQIE